MADGLVLVDTSAWSLFLRRTGDRRNRAVVEAIAELVSGLRVTIIGPVRQELLSGISNKAVFDRLKDALAVIDDSPLDQTVYEMAAEFHNSCRVKGIQGSSVDFLICAAAAANNWRILTLDKDFEHYAKHLPISLYVITGAGS